MRIGIGAGLIGGTLTRDPQTLAELAAETGATAVWAGDAAADADLVIVTVPQQNVVECPNEFRA